MEPEPMSSPINNPAQFGIGKTRSVNSEEQFSAFNISQHINLVVGSATPIFIKKMADI